LLLAIIGVVNVSMAFVGLVRIVWGWIGKDMMNGRKEVGESGRIGVDFFHFDFCIVNGHANAG